MSETVQPTRLVTLLDEAQRVFRELAALDLVGYSDDDAVAALRGNERLAGCRNPWTTP